MRPLRPWLISAIAFVIAFDVAFLWQRAAAAHLAEFGAHPDEAAHYVTGLMIRDYLAAGCPGSPMKFAENYYAHYPKIGLGVWPPFFYLVQSAWTLPFGVSRTSVLLLMCALAAIVAVLVFRALQKQFGPIPAALGGLLFLSLPIVREYYSMVMAETLSAACMFGAALAFGEYLDRERPRHAIVFGVLAALAILTKGTGIALALMAPLALLLTRKWHLLARPALWASAAIVAILAGPWTWHFRNEGRLKGGWLQPNPSWDFTLEALQYYAGKMALSLGAAMCAAAAVGLLSWLIRSMRVPRAVIPSGASGSERSRGTPRATADAGSENEIARCPSTPLPSAPAEGSSAQDDSVVGSLEHGFWSACAALIVSIVAFQAITPVGLEVRHLLPALPAAMMFAIAGFIEVGRALSKLRGTDVGTPVSASVVPLSLALPFFAMFLANPFFWLNPHRKLWSGFRPLAHRILEDKARPNAKILVSSDGSGEGMFISELAMHEQRPGHKVERASKVLAKMAWSGAGYQARFAEDEEMLAFLTGSGIEYVVVDQSMPEKKRGAHHDMLRRVCEEHTDRFWLAGSSPVTRGGITDFPPIRLYRILR